jgi:uncharacterized protein with HEPN domain
VAISHHLDHIDADEDIVFDAIRVRLIEIGEAAKDLPSEVTDLEPSIPWALITRMRDHLAHRYFDTTHAIVLGTARNDVVALEAAVRRILASE